MIDPTNEVINDIMRKKQKKSKGTTEKVTPANGSDLSHSRLEQKKVKDDNKKNTQTGKEKSREFRDGYAKKHNESEKAKGENTGSQQYGKTYNTGLSYGIQQHTNPIRKKLFEKQKDEER